jgi:ArsR family transcriptional regulator
VQNLLRLLSDPTRLRILAAVEDEELAVNEIAEVLKMSQSRISNHLRLLRGEDALRSRRDGAWTFYRNVLSEGDDTAALWAAVKEGVAGDAALRADRKRRDSVLEQRRRRSREHFAERDAGAEFDAGFLREEMLAALAPRTTVAVDAGCGDGYLTEALAERFDRVLAFDHSPERLEAARRRVTEPHVRFENADVEHLPLAAASCDAVFLSLVLHHVPRIAAAVEEAARVLRPGGRIVVADLAPHDEEAMREQMGDLRLGLDPDEIAADLTRAGFGNVKVRPARDRLVASPRKKLELFIATGQKPVAAKPKRRKRKPKANGSRS